MKSTFCILFYVKRIAVKKDGTAPIFCRITLNGTQTSFSCKLFVPLDKWDAKSGMATGRDVVSRHANSEIKKIRKNVRKHYDTIFNGLGPLTAERVKHSYLGFDRCGRTLLQVFENHNKDYEQLVINGIRKEATYDRYCCVYKHIQEFLWKKYRLKDIAIEDIRSNFIADFEAFLKNKKGCSNNTTCIYITPLRKMISIAINNGWLVCDPFFNYRISIQRKDRVYLTMNEIENIANMQFTKFRKNYELIRDLFVFCTFTGVSYIDLKHLKHENLKLIDGELWLCFNRHKTGISCNIPLLETAKEILERHKNPDKAQYLFTLPVYQTLLSGIKRIVEKCGIEKDISWHTSRHSFASEVCLLNGVPIETISRMLGHTDVKTTQIYAKVSNTAIRRDMANLAERLKRL
ncbi:site-specific integrase [Phocaeicola sp.]|uniref:site-specific integrase n=1 Tax=Phocaeicola sp. TaxID=2773926 RepID=UPI0023CC2FE1|nr:site-specific integrase [Phocaeicola sp.]MDE5676699.1 site-specific integrase [Phocaeicola sp.]